MRPSQLSAATACRTTPRFSKAGASGGTEACFSSSVAARARIDIEDLAQETYLRLLRAPDLREIRNPQAYVLKVAAHVVAEWRHGQPSAAAQIPMDDDLLVEASTPEFDLEACISQDRTGEVLTALSPRVRAVLLLRLRDMLAYKEIAQNLGLTDGQVKRYLERGYEQLAA